MKDKILKNIFNAASRLKLLVKPTDYLDYWQNRYERHGDSGVGSAGDLRIFKTDFINSFIKEKNISRVIDFGCGDGRQIINLKINEYLGLDVAPAAINLCREIYKTDETKSFMVYNPKSFENKNFIQADLVICLDVLYHITDEDDFKKTLRDIFSCSSDWVILYTNTGIVPVAKRSHIVYRDTLDYLKGLTTFKIEEIVKQKYPEQSGADFIVLKKITGNYV